MLKKFFPGKALKQREIERLLVGFRRMPLGLVPIIWVKTKNQLLLCDEALYFFARKNGFFGTASRKASFCWVFARRKDRRLVIFSGTLQDLLRRGVGIWREKIFSSGLTLGDPFFSLIIWPFNHSFQRLRLPRLVLWPFSLLFIIQHWEFSFFFSFFLKNAIQPNLRCLWFYL